VGQSAVWISNFTNFENVICVLSITTVSILTLLTEIKLTDDEILTLIVEASTMVLVKLSWNSIFWLWIENPAKNEKMAKLFARLRFVELKLETLTRV